ncbi:MAG: N-acetyltransferase [Actinomycetaceae bacterium]|nr:N-acetyltransferase [Actinomycetaceae bacterium]
MLNPQITLRPLLETDSDALAQLYVDAYGSDVFASLEAAQREIYETFQSDYGKLIPAATLVATQADELIGCILTVSSPPWEDVSHLVFVIDLFVHPKYRGKGIGHALLASSLNACPTGKQVGLRVSSENHSAVALYRKMGFN